MKSSCRRRCVLVVGRRCRRSFSEWCCVVVLSRWRCRWSFSRRWVVDVDGVGDPLVVGRRVVDVDGVEEVQFSRQSLSPADWPLPAGVQSADWTFLTGVQSANWPLLAGVQSEEGLQRKCTVSHTIFLPIYPRITWSLFVLILATVFLTAYFLELILHPRFQYYS